MINLLRNLLFVYRAKFKYGEYVGLSRLSSRDMDNVLVHLSLPMPNDWDHEDRRRLSLDKCQSKFGDRLSRHWRKRPAIIDSHRFDEDPEYRTVSPHPIRAFAERARLLGCCVIPAIPVEPSGSLTVAVREIVSRNQSGAVVKVSLADLEDGRLKEKIDTVLGGIALTPEEAMLCVELGEFEIGDPDEVARALAPLIAGLPYLVSWSHVYITVGTFDVKPSKVDFNSSKEIKRGEWDLYKALVTGYDLPRRIVYSDYGIENPNFSRAPQNARASAHLRYTMEQGGIVTKGGSIRKSGFRAIRSAAEQIVAHKDFSGSAYSFGDEFIAKIAEGSAVGNPSYWRAAGVSRHAAKVLDQVRAMFGVPAEKDRLPAEVQESLFQDR